jgi:hypothetical protein
MDTNNPVQYAGCAAIDGPEKRAYRVQTLPTDQTVKFRKVQLKSELSVYIWTNGVQPKCTEYALQAIIPAKRANMSICRRPREELTCLQTEHAAES